MEIPYSIYREYQKGESNTSSVEDELVKSGGLDNLEGWMSETAKLYADGTELEFEEENWKGRLYVTNSSSISYNEEQNSLVQGASSPSYFGGLWSLACCKKDMRGSNPFTSNFQEVSEGHYKPAKPVFIFTISSISHYPGTNRRGQWLASVALVTDGFYEVEKYGQYLLDNHEGAVVENRITRRGKDSEHIGARKGDCHIDHKGTPGAPSPKHDHAGGYSCGCVEDNGFKKDLDESHLKLVSEPQYWVAWETPRFETTDTIGSSRWGLKIRQFNPHPENHGVRDRLEEVTPQ